MTSDTSEPMQAIDAARPWLGSYPRQVPRSIEPIPNVSLYQLLVDSARRHPHAPAIAWFGRHLTYAELERECERFSAVLASLGVHRGDRVALILPNCPEYVIAYYATIRIGAIVVGNNPLYTERELSHQLIDAEPSVVVVLDALYPSSASSIAAAGIHSTVVTSVGTYMPFVKRMLAPWKLSRDAKREGKPWPPVPAGAAVLRWRDLMRSPAAAPPPADVDAERDVAALVYTGGTTGVSKGAMLTHRNLVANAMQSAAWFVDTESGRESILSVLPFFHCYGMTVAMNLGVAMAAKLVLLPRFEVRAVMREIERERPTLFPGVPKIYSLINDAAGAGGHDLSSIRSCLSGAGALPAPVAERFRSLTGATVAEGYGLTEASPVVAGNPLDGSARPGTIGVPLPDTECRIVDLEDPRRVLPAGEQGELQVRGPQVMLGYRNRPDETAAIFVDGWLRTGDVAVMDGDGSFRIVDRLKDMIKVSGFNVYPTEVEEVLLRHPKVARACVVGVPDGRGSERVKAFIVLRRGEPATAEEIVAWCRDPATGLTGYRVPTEIEFRETLPETLIGKVLRRVLLEEERQRAGSSSG